MSTHYPVMMNEVIEALALKDKAIVVDGTFGGGGYTKAILDSANVTVAAIDKDPEAIVRSQEIKDKYQDIL